MADNVKVAVRVRPFNQRYVSARGVCAFLVIRTRDMMPPTDYLKTQTRSEKDRNSKCIISMEGPTTVVAHPDDKDNVKRFTFDFSYNSFVPRDDPSYASQKTVWEDIGVGILNNAFQGYNCSLFAYGQTGSGVCGGGVAVRCACGRRLKLLPHRQVLLCHGLRRRQGDHSHR